MIVARFWSEHRIQHREGDRGRQVTIRRWGWSDAGQAEADAMAKVRAEAAMAEALAGGKPDRREPKVPYNGADGVPIREEILAEHPGCGAVITRNRYGAHCLNVPDVLFADIDLSGWEHTSRGELTGCAQAVVTVIAIAAFLITHSWWALMIGGAVVATLLLWRTLAGIQRRLLMRSPERMARRVGAWCAANPGWLVHLYQSPAGYRLLAGHALFAAGSAEVSRLFRHFAVDPEYARMCRAQRCFRARLTAKPWRIGIGDKMGSGTWPPQTDAARQRREGWVLRYEASAAGHASCRFVATVGDGQEHPRAAAVRRLHDDLGRAHSGLPLA